MKVPYFALLEKNVISCEKRGTMKKLTAFFCQTVGNLFFMLWAYIAFYGLLPKIFDNKPLRILKDIKFLKTFYKPYTNLANELSLPKWTPILFSIIGCILFAIILDLLFMSVSGLLVKKSNTTLTGSDKDKANSLISRIEDSQKGILVNSKYKKIISFVFFAITTATIVVILLKKKNISTEELVFNVILVEGLVFVSYLILQEIYYSIAKNIFKNIKSSTKNSTKKELEDFLSEVKAEEKRINKQKEKLEKQRKAEEKRIQEEENKKRAKELYDKATKKDEIDEELVKKAADLGNPDACLYIGKKLMKDYVSDEFTKKEKDKILDKAKNFLLSARYLNTEGKFLNIWVSVLKDSKSLKEWQNDLKTLRNIKNSNELPEEYDDTLNNLLSVVVATIDELEEEIAAKETYVPEPSPTTYTPKVVHDCHDCKYFMQDVDLPFPVCTLHEFHFEGDYSSCDRFTYK